MADDQKTARQRLLNAILSPTRDTAPRVDALAQELALPIEDVRKLGKQLADEGLAMQCSAPNGSLLYATLRGVENAE